MCRRYYTLFSIIIIIIIIKSYLWMCVLNTLRLFLYKDVYWNRNMTSCNLSSKKTLNLTDEIHLKKYTFIESWSPFDFPFVAAFWFPRWFSGKLLLLISFFKLDTSDDLRLCLKYLIISFLLDAFVERVQRFVGDWIWYTKWSNGLVDCVEWISFFYFDKIRWFRSQRISQILSAECLLKIPFFIRWI